MQLNKRHRTGKTNTNTHKQNAYKSKGFFNTPDTLNSTTLLRYKYIYTHTQSHTRTHTASTNACTLRFIISLWYLALYNFRTLFLFISNLFCCIEVILPIGRGYRCHWCCHLSHVCHFYQLELNHSLRFVLIYVDALLNDQDWPNDMNHQFRPIFVYFFFYRFFLDFFFFRLGVFLFVFFLYCICFVLIGMIRFVVMFTIVTEEEISV